MEERQLAEAAPSAVDLTLVDEIVERGLRPRDAAAGVRGRDVIRQFVAQFLDGHLTIDRDVELMIAKRIKQIDAIISAQLNEILHHEDFQKLEASWRGLHHLVSNSRTGTMLKIKVMSCTKAELHREFEKAPDFDQNALFKKVYEEEYGMFGGAPFATLIGDYEFNHSAEDIELLGHLSNVAAAAHAPFLSSAHPSLLNLEDWTKVNNPRDLALVHESREFAAWKSFRNSDDSRYVGLCLPRTLGRLPYGRNGKKTVEFSFEEGVDGKDHSKYLWTNAAYVLGTCVTRSFSTYGMAVAIRGVQGGGLVRNLPVHTFDTGEGAPAMKCPTEVQIPDRRSDELAAAGFIPLLHRKNEDYAAFFSIQSCQKPGTYDNEDANASALLSTQLPYIFAISRFAHYMKSMMRDRIGSFMSREQVQNFLDRWIMQYVTPDEHATAESKASKPLFEAQIKVLDVAGKPGTYQAVMLLRPHFQLDGLTASLRLVAELPAAARQ